jgi:hypothetical protein
MLLLFITRTPEKNDPVLLYVALQLKKVQLLSSLTTPKLKSVTIPLLFLTANTKLYANCTR